MIWQAKLPETMIVLVGTTTGVGEKNIKITVDVAVSVGVSVLRVGVRIGVDVEEGNPAAVCVAAAFAV